MCEQNGFRVGAKDVLYSVNFPKWHPVFTAKSYKHLKDVNSKNCLDL